MEEAISSSGRSRHVGELGGEVEGIAQAEGQTLNGAWQWEKLAMRLSSPVDGQQI